MHTYEFMNHGTCLGDLVPTVLRSPGAGLPLSELYARSRNAWLSQTICKEA